MDTFSPRQELAEITRDRIITAAAHLIENGEPMMFRALSQVSGIPERTIFRYFPHKDAVLEAFWAWLNQEIAIPGSPETPEDIAPYARALFVAFDRRSGLVRAMLASPSGMKLRDAGAVARRAKFAHALALLTAKLPDADGQALVAGVEAICSAPGWQSLSGSVGTGADVAAVWAIQAMLDRAKMDAR